METHKPNARPISEREKFKQILVNVFLPFLVQMNWLHVIDYIRKWVFDYFSILQAVKLMSPSIDLFASEL